ncbi:SH2 domain-containing protein 6 [Gopherus flavomarginatus]|uniref:SH2 domain-containing protein 6 n=1 Tax=Gopherus flavomarginatus TaxID=286002 RepID=UPI0021CBEF0A|nr:SH2 domain-containing protein 6 [Gopherus flavomarginatus]
MAAPGPSAAKESEEGDTYEAPPCESQAWKVAPAKRQEDTDGTYLDHTTARRCSEPFALLPAKFLSKLSLVPGTEPGNGEEMPQGLACGKGQDRTRAKLPPAPGPRSLSSPAGPAAPRHPGPTSSDDKEGPPEEEIYLVCEPTSPPHGRTTRALRPQLGQVPPPWLPKLSKPKIALPGAHHSLADSSPEASSKAPAWPRGSGSPVEDPGMQDQAWYAGSCDRHVAESVLQGVNKDSAFMVRQSSGQGWNQPFTLAVLYKGHVYNIPIRYVESSHQYVLGKDGKSHEERFDSVAGIIQHYREHPLVLIEGSSASRAHTCLLFPVKP